MGNESFGQHGLPAGVQGPSATSRMPVAAVPYPTSFPFIHPMINQVMMRAPSCFALPSPSMPFWMMAQHQIQAQPQAPLDYDTVFHSYTVMSRCDGCCAKPAPCLPNEPAGGCAS